MQKVKDLLHKNRDANHNGIPDSQERMNATTSDAIVHDHGTTLGNPVVAPATGTTAPVVVQVPNSSSTAPLYVQPSSNHSTNSSTGPVQKVKDLLHMNRDRNHNGIPDSQERDRNHNGIPDSQEKVGLGQRVKNVLPTLHVADQRPAPVAPVQPLSAPVQSAPAPSAALLNQQKGHLVHLDGERVLESNLTSQPSVPLQNAGSSSAFYDQGLAPSAVLRTTENPVVQVVEKNVVVHEHIHPVEKEEIQPIIYREREQMDIKQITQQLHETQIQPTLIQQRELAPQYREAVVERSAPIQENVVLPTTTLDATVRSVQVNAPIVNETIKKTVIEEIQPVLERDVFQPVIVQQTQPIYEKVIEAPSVYREILPMRELGTRTLGTGEVLAYREVEPVVPQQHLIQPVTVVTTTTTTDSFVPAKLIAEQKTLGSRSPVERRVL